ncbi:MAG: hypothetical protein MK194_16185 [Roseibacillus sp.]|nr:hypothetical protein [Roseibacillus sp.]
MKRRLSQDDSTGSMDLMLDILTNVFGAVILIACLLAILPRHSGPSVLLPIAEAQSDMLERRIQRAEKDLADLQRELVRVEESVDPQRASQAARLDSLKETFASLKEEVDRMSRGEEVLAEAQALSALGRREELERKLKDLKQQVVSAESLSRASQEKIDFLSRRKSELESQIEGAEKGKIQTVRFPREKGRAGNPFPVILKYGRVYPLAEGVTLKDSPTIKRTAIGLGNAFLAEPIKGRGHQLPAASGDLGVTLKVARRENLYVSIYVYPDSHDVFQIFKELIFESNLRYGLEFMPPEQSIRFSSSGSKPPEL